MMRVVAGLFSRHWETEWVSKVGFRSCSEGVALWRACTQAYTGVHWRTPSQRGPISVEKNRMDTAVSNSRHLVPLQNTAQEHDSAKRSLYALSLHLEDSSVGDHSWLK